MNNKWLFVLSFIGILGACYAAYFCDHHQGCRAARIQSGFESLPGRHLL